ncbi:MAG: molybdenum cofactor biosynthesis protein MoaE [Methanospirillaceae archaeon]|nr:molybdenum cofactor biosynthesis protein MoaE [Methanospirillaceae archaeon]
MIAITPDTINIAEMISAAIRPEAGGMVIFLGTVRDDGIEALDCESFHEVALADLNSLAAEAQERFSLCSVDIVHRIGRLAITEPIVLIIVTASHRDEAYEGSRYILDKIKEYVPIWKREITGGSERWIH